MTNKTIISPHNKFHFISLKDLLNYKQLLFSLAWRDIKVKYAQTYIGLLWAIITPIITISLLSFVFQKVANVSTNGIPPLVFSMSGYIIWAYFSTITTEAGQAILGAQEMVKKIYFPRLILPLSKVLSSLVELGIMMIILVLLLFYFKINITVKILFAPLFILLSMFLALSSGIWVSALTIRYRDFKFIIPFFLQLSLFVSPIAYPSDLIGTEYQNIYMTNPMVGIIDGFRWSILGTAINHKSLIISLLVTLILNLTGLFYFSKIEHEIADII